MMLPRLPALNIGTDICDARRILRLLAGKAGLRFVQRVLTKEELSLDGSKKVIAAIANKPTTFKLPLKRGKDLDPLFLTSFRALEKAAQYMAGRWAAKEAVQKAYNIRRMSLHDIEIKTKSQIFPGSEPRVPPLLEQEQEEPEQNTDSKSAANPLDSEQNSEQKPDPLTEKLETMTGSGPPVAVIKGHGIYEDVYASISISHDGGYAIASCIVDNSWPKRLQHEEPNKNESDVD
ncbi:hypothetical protein F5B19DRAFT_443791 [Rostrohypoxylon terebratum]|nr:hypothetical protein F5B19DRAFT_443791 [Rostrohypoxylon terebratum]